MRFLIFALIVTCGPASADEVYFSKLVRQDGFRQSWAKLVTGHRFRKEDGWILRHDGLRGTMTAITVDGEGLLKDEGCQPHDCLDNSIVILANPKTRRLWMVHRMIAFPSRAIRQDYFGDPDPGMKAALASHLAKP